MSRLAIGPSVVIRLYSCMKRTFLAFFLFVCIGAHPALAQPVIDHIVDAASYSANLSPGGWAAIFGKSLAQQLAQAESVPLSGTLGGVAVTVDGVAAPLHFVSPGQINAVIPAEIAVPDTGKEVSVIVTTSDGIAPPTASVSRRRRRQSSR